MTHTKTDHRQPWQSPIHSVPYVQRNEPTTVLPLQHASNSNMHHRLPTGRAVSSLRVLRPQRRAPDMPGPVISSFTKRARDIVVDTGRGWHGGRKGPVDTIHHRVAGHAPALPPPPPHKHQRALPHVARVRHTGTSRPVASDCVDGLFTAQHDVEHASRGPEDRPERTRRSDVQHRLGRRRRFAWHGGPPGPGHQKPQRWLLSAQLLRHRRQRRCRRHGHARLRAP